MKTKFLRAVVIGIYLFCCVTLSYLALGQPPQAPTILAQPASLVSDYGSNVTFTATVNGALGFQWKKNGTNLVDYENVIGSKTATLKLVGVAQKDAAAYTLVASNSVGSVISSNATLNVKPVTVFSDDFETGSLSNWTPFTDSTSLTNSSGQNNSDGGSRSALLTSSTDKMYHNLGTKLSGRVKATFWIYDDNGPQTRYYGELRGYTGPGHGSYASPGGLKQSLAIGKYSAEGTNGILSGETLDVTKYQGRVDRGKTLGWFNLNANGAPGRSTGWHKFEIDRAADGTNVSFYVDGVLGRTITGANYAALDCIAIGSIGKGNTIGNAWFDDVKLQAFPQAFDWETLDSRGHGLFDWIALREVGEQLATNITGVSTVAQENGFAKTAAQGTWVTDGLGVQALDGRGYVDYTINAPSDDAYRIEVEGGERDFKAPIVALPLTVSIDGEYLGRFILPYGPQSNGVVRCFTPFIKAGNHTIRIHWDNAWGYCSLYINAVRLQSLIGPDTSGNGKKDWVKNRLQSESGVEFVPTNSFVSPVCIEGRGQYLSTMTLQAGDSYPLSSVAIHHGAGNRWYANVPLSQNNVTRAEISHQNGGLKETNDIIWLVTNLMEANNATIRKGDSLLFNAVPAGWTNGGVSISIVGVTNYIADAAMPAAHCFNQTGTFTVTGTFTPTGASRSITVKVVEASLNGPIAAWVGKRRYWTCTNLPPEAVFENDPRLTVTHTPLTNGIEYAITTDAAVPRYVLARLGTNGPILASAVVEGFRLFNSADTYLRLIESYEDGSQLVESAFILSPVLPSVSVELQLIVSGVTFDNGSVTRTLTSADFDSLGVCKVRFIRGAGVKTSVCHATKAYQNGVLIGWPSH